MTGSKGCLNSVCDRKWDVVDGEDEPKIDALNDIFIQNDMKQATDLHHK